jgi:hypothetical protein
MPAHAESDVSAAEGADVVPATANAEGGQRKRKAEGPDTPTEEAESIASDTTEGGTAAVSIDEAEGGLRKVKRQRKKPQKRKISAAHTRRANS